MPDVVPVMMPGGRTIKPNNGSLKMKVSKPVLNHGVNLRPTKYPLNKRHDFIEPYKERLLIS
jgi:hypothetical protein